MRVAVLGAGITGACAALELAEAGCDVDLFDRAAQPLSRASRNNEGKLHLGLVYAKDASGRTAATMIRGAARFRPLLSRWLDAASFEESLSGPFFYAVPVDSMLSPDAICRHFDQVAAMLAREKPPASGGYVRALDGPLWEPLSAADFRGIFDAQRVLCAFRTQELAVEPTRICTDLRAVLRSMPRLEPRCLTTVHAVARERGGRFLVRSSHGERERTDAYDCVVNALWEERLAVDASLGLSAPRQVAHRYKVGLRTSEARVAAQLPTVTFVLGSYGDTVAYPGHAYASWYPAGLLHQEFALRPKPFDGGIGPEERARLIDCSLDGLRALMPGAAHLLQRSAADWEVVGGYITAWGSSGIDDAGSELHQRSAVGVASEGNYHSIDTGKFTLGPLFAADACARILRREAACA